MSPSLDISLGAQAALPPTRIKGMPGVGSIRPEIQGENTQDRPKTSRQIPPPHSGSQPIPSSHPTASTSCRQSSPPSSSLPKALATSPGHVQPPSFRELERAKRVSAGADSACPSPLGSLGVDTRLAPPSQIHSPQSQSPARLHRAPPGPCPPSGKQGQWEPPSTGGAPTSSPSSPSHNTPSHWPSKFILIQ